MFEHRETDPGAREDKARPAPERSRPDVAPGDATEAAGEYNEDLRTSEVAETGANTHSDLRELISRRRGTSASEREQLLGQPMPTEGQVVDSLRREIAELRQLVQISRELASILDPDQLCQAILDSAVRLVGADRGVLLLEENHELKVVLARGLHGDSLPPEDTSVSMTLARRCLEENRIIPHNNLAEMPELWARESIRSLNIFSAVCVPLRDRGAPTGVLYLDSSLPEMRSTAESMGLLEAFGSQAAVALVNARLHRRLEEARIRLERENEGLRAEVGDSVGLGQIIGQSRAMQSVFERIRLLKDTEISVLLLGESGTGKDMVARALHNLGQRRAGPFTPVNCASIPAGLMESTMFGYKRGAFTGAVQGTPGLVEEADGGTLFLDEVGDLPLLLQPKLLQFLESGEFRRVGDSEGRRASVRVISATNADLSNMIRQKAFREDLYYRLAGIRIELPPLRERREDLPLLIDHFLASAREKTARRVAGITERARGLLLRYPWPGNVRELRHVIEGAYALVPEGNALDEEQIRIQLPHLEEARSVPRTGKLKERSATFERETLLDALTRSEWNVTHAARELGISRQHLHNRMRQYGIARPTAR